MKKKRCPWADPKKPLYLSYHDEEWGVPVYDDQKWFEFLTLESAQAGLNWYTVLSKRENYRKAFAGFDPRKVARFTTKKIETLLKNPGIIRNRLKVNAAVKNAKLFLQVQKEFGSFNDYMWSFVNYQPIVASLRSMKDYKATTDESDAMSKDLKQRGFSFVGSTICYAHMQASGLVNDHIIGCFRRKEIIDSYTDMY